MRDSAAKRSSSEALAAPDALKPNCHTKRRLSSNQRSENTLYSSQTRSKTAGIFSRNLGPDDKSVNSTWRQKGESRTKLIDFLAPRFGSFFAHVATSVVRPTSTADAGTMVTSGAARTNLHVPNSTE